MKTRSFGLTLMVVGACAYGAGCGSSNNTAKDGSAGTGGHSTGGATGNGGSTGTGGRGIGGATGTGGAADAGQDVRPDAGNDVRPDLAVDLPAVTDVRTDAVDGPVDAPADTGDAGVGPTFTEVFAILSNITTPTPDTSPGCANCHDGANTAADAAPTRLPHLLNFKDKNIAYAQLFGIDSLRCTAADGGTPVRRVVANSPNTSILVQKIRQGLGMGTACDGVGMPLDFPNVVDGGADAGDGGGADAGFRTHYAVTAAQLQTIVGWINAGARNN